MNNDELVQSRQALRNGRTIRTFKGHYLDIFNPEVDAIDIEDIAHALSHICRFAGHTKNFYSVAQHCIECVVALYRNGNYDKKLMLTALLHDASEAYIGDLASPIKARIPQYKTAENLLMSVICQKFNIAFPFPPMIKTVDAYLLELEHDGVMMNNHYFPCSEPKLAKQQFLFLFNILSDPAHELTIQDFLNISAHDTI